MDLVHHLKTSSKRWSQCWEGRKEERQKEEWRENRLTLRMEEKGRGRRAGWAGRPGPGARRQGRHASAAGRSSFHIVLLSAPTTSSAMLKGHWLCSATSTGCLLGSSAPLSVETSSPIWVPICHPGGNVRSLTIIVKRIAHIYGCTTACRPCPRHFYVMVKANDLAMRPFYRWKKLRAGRLKQCGQGYTALKLQSLDTSLS